ncbi:MAG: 30S ribosomal protein S1 [Bryobacteraceae bacterium]|nr:30S ribosomal protein S1 [Bryobacteraceae bacterium]
MPDTEDDRQSETQAPGPEGDYAQLLDDYTHFAPPSEGEVYKGTILSVTDKEAIVDFGYKSEGLVPLEQLRAADGTVIVRPGDVIDVMIDRSAERPEGYVLLSYEKAHRVRAWDELDRALRENLTVLARVTAKIKGGLTVDVGVPAFMPGSQVAARPIYNLDQFVGTDTPVKIVKLNRRRGNVVVSRRLAVEEEEHSRKSQALQVLNEGEIVQGIVKNLTDYGAFVDLGGIDGLLHVSDMSFGRIQHPSEMIHVGDEISVKILKFDKEKERISLGMKQLNLNPWETVEDRYPQGLRVIGRVVSVTDYGAFVELEPGVEGLIHISEMTWSRRMKHPSKVVHVGDQVEAVVLEVKPKERRVSLGIKQLEADPWTTVADRYSIGSVVEGRVRKLTDFGAFIEIEEGIDGLVHISDLSWTRRIGHPSEVLKKGQLVQAVVLQIDPLERRLSLGVKQLQPDAWETFFRTYNIGDVVRGRVCRASNFGVFVEVSPGVEGLCHNSEIPEPADHQKTDPPLPINEEFDFKVIKLNEADKKIGLSLKAATEDQERNPTGEYGRQAAAASSSSEEVINATAHGEN